MAKRRGGGGKAKDEGGGDTPRGLDPAGLRKALAAGQVAPVYLLVGAESYLRLEALAALREALPNADLTEYDGAQATLAQVLDEWRTMSFLGDRRLVIVRAAGELITEHPDALLAATREPPPNATLVLEAQKVDRRFKAAKALVEALTVVTCASPERDGLVRFARERATALGRSLSPRAAESLLDRLGGKTVSLAALEAEVGKLSAAGKGPIEIDDVMALTQATSSEDSFALVNRVGAGDVQGALATLGGILRDGLVNGSERLQDPTGVALLLLGLLRWDLGRLLRGRALLEQGKKPFDIYGALRVFHDKERFLSRLRRATVQDLGERHALLREADAAVKTSTDARAVLTTLVVRLARRER